MEGGGLYPSYGCRDCGLPAFTFLLTADVGAASAENEKRRERRRLQYVYVPPIFHRLWTPTPNYVNFQNQNQNQTTSLFFFLITIVCAWREHERTVKYSYIEFE